MKIIVLVKPVPSEISFDNKGKLNRNKVKSIINPQDRNALEEAIKIKKLFGGQVIAVAMGIGQAKNVLDDALVFGADEAYLISDPIIAGSDTNATAHVLNKFIDMIGQYDIIICGNRSSDSATGQVGIELATKLNIPFAINVDKLEVINNQLINCLSKNDNGHLEIKINLPALVTVTNAINTPHIPSISDILSGRGKTVKIVNAQDLNLVKNNCGIIGSPTRVNKVTMNQSINKQCSYITGSLTDQVKSLLTILNNNCQQKINNEIDKFDIRENKYLGKDIFVYCYEEENKISLSSLLLLAKAHEFSLILNASVTAIYINQSEQLIKTLFQYGANKVIYLEGNSNNYFDLSDNILSLVKKYNPDIFLFDKSYNSKIISAVIAGSLNTGLSADCYDLKINEDCQLIQQRNVYDGKMNVDIICPIKRPQMATTNLINTKLIYNVDNIGEIIKYPLILKNNIEIKDIKTANVENYLNKNLVIGIGVGVQDINIINKIEVIAQKYNGCIGATRRAVDQGIMSCSKQIGITGKPAKCNVYLACGLSGSSEHISDVKSNIVIAINKDKNAKIFKYADYGIVADINDIINLLSIEVEK